MSEEGATDATNKRQKMATDRMRTLFQGMAELLRNNVPVVDDEGKPILDRERLEEDDELAEALERTGPQALAGQVEEALQRPLDGEGLKEFARRVGLNDNALTIEDDAGAYFAALDMAGDDDDLAGPRALAGEYHFLGRDAVAEKWRELCGHDFSDAARFTPANISPDQTDVRFTWYDHKWIPFAMEPGGNLLCLDFHPGASGSAGQVIMWETKGGGPEGVLGTGSLVDLLQQYLDDLEKKKYAWSAEEYEIVEVDDDDEDEEDDGDGEDQEGGVDAEEERGVDDKEGDEK